MGSIRRKIEAKKYEKQMKSYLHSYLKWLYHQNHHFTETLTDDELVNYFVKQIKHDAWFTTYIQSDTIEVMSDIYDFISAYKKEAMMLEYTIPIIPIQPGKYHSMEIKGGPLL